MRVIVTGGSGFIGTNLVDHFIKRGHEVCNLDLVAPRHPDHGTYWRQIDLLDGAALQQAVADFDPEWVLHMAARTDLGGTSLADYPANAIGVSNLIAALKPLMSLKWVGFASSMLVCRIGYRPISEVDYQPSTAYGESKIDGELRVRREAAQAFPWTILRPTSIWGPWFGPPYRDFFEMVQRGVYVHPLGRRIRRNYGFVLNSVFQIEQLAKAGGADQVGRTIYMGDYEPIELKAWGDQIQKELGVRRIREMPVIGFQILAKLGDLLKAVGRPGFPMSSFRLNNLLTDCLLDTDPIRSVAGPLPYDLPQAVTITCRWLQTRRAQA